MSKKSNRISPLPEVRFLIGEGAWVERVRLRIFITGQILDVYHSKAKILMKVLDRTLENLCEKFASWNSFIISWPTQNFPRS